MSRTDKTAPPTVKVFYYPHWLEECHDHTHGECDLPPRPRSAKGWTEQFQLWHGARRLEDESQCYWVASYTQYYTNGLSHCPCGMCSARWPGERRDPKRIRREGRRLARDWWKEIE